jgi:hypothetical protein
MSFSLVKKLNEGYKIDLETYRAVDAFTSSTGMSSTLRRVIMKPMFVLDI